MHALYDRAPGPQGGILTLGTFDGVHRGHLTLIQACRQWAGELHTHTVVWIYHPHPRTVLRGEVVPLLTTLPERMALLKAADVEVLRVISFSRELASLSAEVFVAEWIRALEAPGGVVLGYDHRFGRGREGSAQLLQQMGLPVREVPPVVIEGQPVSSSRIRQLLQKGAVAEAASLLGYPYTVGGKVVEGRQEARRLGTPTANLPWPEEKVRPAAGIYVGWAAVEPTHVLPVVQGLPALLYLPPAGPLEVHLLTEQRTLYEKELRVSFLRQLRSHQLFSDDSSLKAQVEADVAEARRYFGL